MKLPHNKAVLFIGGALVLYLVYRWYQNQQANASGTSAQAPVDSSGAVQDPTGSDFSTLAGQIQQTQAQEQSDVSALGTQEQTDIGNLTALITGLGNQLKTANAAIVKAAKGERKLQQDLAAERKRIAQLSKRVNGNHRDTGGGGHTNNHHPTGTAGHTVASSSHNQRTRRKGP